LATHLQAQVDAASQSSLDRLEAAIEEAASRSADATGGDELTTVSDHMSAIEERIDALKQSMELRVEDALKQLATQRGDADEAVRRLQQQCAALEQELQAVAARPAASPPAPAAGSAAGRATIPTYPFRSESVRSDCALVVREFLFVTRTIRDELLNLRFELAGAFGKVL